MPTSLRFPAELPPPLRDPYGDTYEETRSRTEREIGVARMRNVTRVAPLMITVEWMFTPAQYAVFDKWFETYLRGGERPFDIQLSDDVGLLQWYTVFWIGTYRAEIVNGYNWRVSGTLRSIEVPFAVRPSGTDELGGLSEPTIRATGALVIEPVFFGRAELELIAEGTLDALPVYGLSEPSVTGTGVLLPRPFWGSAAVEVTADGRLEDLGAPELILEFDAVIYNPPAGGAVALQFDNVPYLPPSVAVP